MNNNDKKIYALIALPYATGDLHIGRLISTFYPADFFRRYFASFENKEVKLISGLDCYGPSVYLESKKLGINPEFYIDRKKKEFEETLKSLNIDLILSKTNTLIHENEVSLLLDDLTTNNRIIKRQKKINYCSKCSMFLYDRFLCMKNNISHEKYLQTLSIKQQNNFKEEEHEWFCLFCKTKVEKRASDVLVLLYDVEEQNYKTFLSKTNFRQYEKEITRPNMLWGLRLKGKTRKLLEQESTIYVWIEALLSYITFLKEHQADLESSEVYYFHGKDNEYFHKVLLNQMCPYKPLKCTEDNSFIRNYILMNKEEKFSTSKGLYYTYNSFKSEYNVPQFRLGLAFCDTYNDDVILDKEKLDTAKNIYQKKLINVVRRIEGLKKVVGSQYDEASNTRLRELYQQIEIQYCENARETRIKLCLELALRFQHEIAKVIDQSMKEKNLKQTFYDLLWAVSKLEKLIEPITGTSLFVQNK